MARTRFAKLAKKKSRCVMFRGPVRLSYGNAELLRDFHGEEILKKRGQIASAFATTEEEAKRMNSPYLFTVRSPGQASLPWTAFRTAKEFQEWLKAYGLTLREHMGRHVQTRMPGAPQYRVLKRVPDDNKFHDLEVIIPPKPRFQKLECVEPVWSEKPATSLSSRVGNGLELLKHNGKWTLYYYTHERCTGNRDEVLACVPNEHFEEAVRATMKSGLSGTRLRRRRRKK